MTETSQKACWSRKKTKKKKTRHVKNGFESQNSQLPLFYCSEPALPAVRLGGRETRPLVAAWDWFQSPSVLCPSQITIHFWLPRFSSVWIQKALWGSLTNTMSRHLTGRLWRAVWRTRDGICAISTREHSFLCYLPILTLSLRKLVLISSKKKQDEKYWQVIFFMIKAKRLRVRKLDKLSMLRLKL